MPTTQDYFKQTRVSLPKKIGAATIKNALEVCDAVGCIETVIRHISANSGIALNKRCEEALSEFKMEKLSLAQANKILTTWKKWTWQYPGISGDLPKLSDCTQFLYNISKK